MSLFIRAFFNDDSVYLRGRADPLIPHEYAGREKGSAIFRTIRQRIKIIRVTQHAYKYDNNNVHTVAARAKRWRWR